VLIEVKATLRLWDTLVAWILMADGPHLSNPAGDTKECMVFMTIRILSLEICQMPSTHTVGTVALVPIAINNRNIPQRRLDEQRQPTQEVAQEVLWRVFQPLTFKHNPNPESGYSNFVCADDNFRGCKPILVAWHPDCPEYSDLHHLERHVCFWSLCPMNGLADHVHAEEQHPRRDYNLDTTLSDANTKAADDKI